MANPEDSRLSADSARAIEAILMVAQEPVDPHLLAQLLEIAPALVEELCTSLQTQYEEQERGFVLVKVAGGYRFQSHADLAAYVETRSLPKAAVVDGAVSDLTGLPQDNVASTALKVGEQVLAARFVNPNADEILGQKVYKNLAELPVVPGAQQGVLDLLNAGVEVWVCTKPLEVNPTCHSDKANWILRHFPPLHDRLIIAPDKAMVVGDVLLDDAPKPEWFERAAWRPVIFDSPFNRPMFPGCQRWTWGQPIADLFPEEPA